MQVEVTERIDTWDQARAFAAVLFAVLVLAGEAVILRTSAKYGLSMGPIAIAQCIVAGSIQFFFGARFSRIEWRNWWPALLLCNLSGLSFYIAIRIAPAALVGLIEPLSLVALMLGHRFIQQKKLTLSCTIALLLLVVASAAAVGQWPEQVGLLAILVSAVGICCSGLSLVFGEVVKPSGLPSFVLAMQATLMFCSGLVGYALESTRLAGRQGMLINSLAVGASTGLFVGLAVTALFYGVRRLGALRAGTLKILRLPTIAVLAYIVINESASLFSALALAAVVVFSILAVRLSN